jgi:hypothetical protein
LFVDLPKSFGDFQRCFESLRLLVYFVSNLCNDCLQLRSEFDLDTPKLKQITERMLSEMDAGLASAGTSSLLMIPTHLTSVPTGKETGSYLALDLGGTNFRVLKVCIYVLVFVASIADTALLPAIAGDVTKRCDCR